MAKHEKKPKHKELEVEIKILWFKLILPLLNGNSIKEV